MLKRLKVENLLLLKKVEIGFEKGFTVITGETGSGKTILLQALKYACGERAENDSVRQGAPKAIIEAEFEAPPSIHSFLEEAGIEWDISSPLLLKREIAKEGKNRAFINCQAAPLSLLQKIAGRLIDFTDQHAHHALKMESLQRELLDRFGQLEKITASSKSSLASFRELEKALTSLIGNKESQARVLERIEEEIEEIICAKFKEGEEEQIEQEHTRLSHLHELLEKGSHLEKTAESLLAQSKKAALLVQQMAAFDRSLESWEKVLAEVSLNLSEVCRFLLSYSSKLEADPKRFEYLEERLRIIDSLKRKYANPLHHLEELQKRKNLFLNLDNEIEKAKLAVQESHAQFLSLASTRFEQRKAASAALGSNVSACLKKLNIPHAEFSIDLEHHPEEDAIEFFLKANPGQPKTALQDHVSGGELSRVMIALQLALGEQFPKPTLIFDEIDANIGGETASGIGEAFRQLGKNRQVIAITHFPQVAKLAQQHIRIDKHFGKTETTTILETLTHDEKAKELTRMLGG